MRLLILVVLSCFAFGLFGQPNQAGNDKQKATQAQGQATTTLNKQEETKAHSTASNSNPPKSYTALEQPEWWLVLAAFVTLYVIWRQTRATELAAAAARDNSQAVLNAERAWVVVDIVTEGYLKFAVKIGNRGRTPADIVEHYISPVFTSWDSKLPNGPLNIEAVQHDGWLLVGGEERFIDRFDFTLHLTQDIRGPVLDGSKVMLYRGRIDYKVIGGKNRYTKFLYSYSLLENRFIAAGKPEDNEHT